MNRNRIKWKPIIIYKDKILINKLPPILIKLNSI
jgi:hypothetical protein